MIVIKIGTIIIGTKIVFINQVLITIHTNPVVRNKANAISDTVFNIQSPWLYLYLYICYIMLYIIYYVKFHVHGERTYDINGKETLTRIK